MQQVAIVIPIYRPVPTANEMVSLEQATVILGNYPFVFICGKSFDASWYTDKCPKAQVFRFEDVYFENISGYSKLMLSAFFYRNFLTYEYMLLYQLDAYVFRDELALWCNKGYDYIGAPWIEPPPLVNGKPKVNLQNYFVGRVGNGGLSLRKVRTLYRNMQIFYPLIKMIKKNEDMFFGLFLYFLNPFFKRPTAEEALLFAFELNPKDSFERTNKKLPFGVHAWEKYDPNFWKPYIKAYT